MDADHIHIIIDNNAKFNNKFFFNLNFVYFEILNQINNVSRHIVIVME